MSAPNLHAVKQPKDFSFTPENMAQAKKILAKYPETRKASGMIPLLQLAQAQHDNWLPVAAMNYVADMLEVPRVKAYEVASFYTMFNRAPVGKYLLQVCTTTPCWLRGSDDIKHVCKSKLGITDGQTSADGMFSMMEVECLGACVNAPMVQINDDYYEDLTGENFTAILDDLSAGKKPRIGSQTGRQGAAPQKKVG